MGDIAVPRQWTGRLDLGVTSRHSWLPGNNGGRIEAHLGRETLTIRDDGRQVAILVRGAFVGWLARPTMPYECDETQWVWRGHSMLLSIRRGGSPARHLALTGPALRSLVEHLTTLA